MENLYELEMKILAASNYSIIKDFIKDYAQERRPDKYAEAAFKFSEKIKDLPKIEDVVKEGDEGKF